MRRLGRGPQLAEEVQQCNNCLNAYHIAEGLGKVQNLCPPWNTFGYEYGECLNCAQANQTVILSQLTPLVPYLLYCSEARLTVSKTETKVRTDSWAQGSTSFTTTRTATTTANVALIYTPTFFTGTVAGAPKTVSLWAPSESTIGQSIASTTKPNQSSEDGATSTTGVLRNPTTGNTELESGYQPWSEPTERTNSLQNAMIASMVLGTLLPFFCAMVLLIAWRRANKKKYLLRASEIETELRLQLKKHLDKQGQSHQQQTSECESITAGAPSSSAPTAVDSVLNAVAEELEGDIPEPNELESNECAAVEMQGVKEKWAYRDFMPEEAAPGYGVRRDEQSSGEVVRENGDSDGDADRELPSPLSPLSPRSSTGPSTWQRTRHDEQDHNERHDPWMTTVAGYHASLAARRAGVETEERRADIIMDEVSPVATTLSSPCVHTSSHQSEFPWPSSAIFVARGSFSTSLSLSRHGTTGLGALTDDDGLSLPGQSSTGDGDARQGSLDTEAGSQSAAGPGSPRTGFDWVREDFGYQFGNPPSGRSPSRAETDGVARDDQRSLSRSSVTSSRPSVRWSDFDRTGTNTSTDHRRGPGRVSWHTA